MTNRILKTARLVALFMLACGLPAATASPAFDCSKAEHEIEQLICSDDELGNLDRELAGVFKKSIEVLKGVVGGDAAIKELRAYQRGWIGGRNDCWKADDKRACTLYSYQSRIAQLSASYGLAPHGNPVEYVCNGNPADTVTATFFETDLPSVRLERGDSQQIGVLQPSASGSRYEAEFGVTFWIKGDEAQVEWPQGNAFTCIAPG